MIHSMTGYGVAKFQDENHAISVEVRSLNSKFLDLNLRIPKLLNEHEPEIRKMITDMLVRGKVSVVVELSQNTPDGQIYNKDLFKHYYGELKGLSEEVGAPDDEIFKIALSSPDVLNTDTGNLGKEEWELIHKLLNEALGQCVNFRINEGGSLQIKLIEYRDGIEKFLNEVVDLEPERTRNMREKMLERLKEVNGQFDENRFEQELIYYIEKLDIQEEIVRLRKHLEHFSEVLSEDHSQGKKLGFISQEIGREINTIGSKANDATIQKLVVGMKDELEKIKEQVLNAV